MPHACQNTPRSPRPYQRRRPEKTALHQIVRDHYQTVLERAETFSKGYPAYVRKEFEHYLACGDLTRGFCRLRCKACGTERLVAFSCKGRLCPSCCNRRMEQTALCLEDELLPLVPYRQWTLTIPWAYRLRLAADKALLSRVTSIFIRTIFAFWRRRARQHGIAKPHCGSVTFVHRFNTLLQLSPHLHSLVPDGVFYEDPDGHMAFAPLPPPTDAEVTHCLKRCAKRIEDTISAAILFGAADDDDDDAMAAALAEAAQPSSQLSLMPVEPRAKKRCARGDGYSLHANVAVEAADRTGLRRLLRYGARPALAQSRVSLTPDGQVSYRLRKILSGRTHITLSPEAFIRRLASLIPPPWLNLTRFHGVFAANAKHHRAVRTLTPKGQAALQQTALQQASLQQTAADAAPLNDLLANPFEVSAETSSETPLPMRIRWAELLRRTFADALVCPNCEGTMHLVSTIEKPEIVTKILRHLGLPTTSPPVAPARPPPQLSFDDVDELGNAGNDNATNLDDDWAI